MKLQELAASPTKQAAKVFESYFGSAVPLDHVSSEQISHLLSRVQGLVQEHRGTAQFHQSEKNPTYLKLIMLEQVLTAKLHEQDMPIATGAVPASATTGQLQALQTAQMQAKKKAIQDQIKIKQQEIADLQKNMNATAMETRQSSRLYRRLHESEIQQAQVVLAAQDMVDRIQKMLEEVTSMQFKDLPALADQVKNEVGMVQSQQFNSEATTALAGLVQNLQSSKQQMEQALGVVTGQESAELPAMDAIADQTVPDADQDTADLAAELDIDADPETPTVALGRGRR